MKTILDYTQPVRDRLAAASETLFFRGINGYSCLNGESAFMKYSIKDRQEELCVDLHWRDGIAEASVSIQETEEPLFKGEAKFAPGDDETPAEAFLFAFEEAMSEVESQFNNLSRALSPLFPVKI